MDSTRQRYPYVIAGVVGLLFVALLLDSALLILIAGLFGLTAAAVLAWGRYALERIEYGRAFSQSRCFVGDEIELAVTLVNRKLLPVTYLSVEDAVPEELRLASRKLQFFRSGTGLLRLVFGLGWYQKVVRRYKVTPTRRGFYQLGPATVSGGDPFGLTRQYRDVESREPLIVYPRIVPLEAVGITSERPFGDLKARNRLFEDPMRFAGVRDYQPGDPLNRIHWKASAVSGHLQVRLLDPSSNVGLAVFLNTYGFDLFWQGIEPVSFEEGCSLAASVVDWAVNEGISVGLYANGLAQGWGQTLRLPPQRSAETLQQALEGLARLSLPSRIPLADLMLDEVQSLGYGTTVVVITRRVDEQLATAIARTRRSGRPVTVIAVAPDQPLPQLPGVQIYTVSGGEEALHAAVLA